MQSNERGELRQLPSSIVPSPTAFSRNVLSGANLASNAKLAEREVETVKQRLWTFLAGANKAGLAGDEGDPVEVTVAD